MLRAWKDHEWLVSASWRQFEPKRCSTEPEHCFCPGTRVSQNPEKNPGRSRPRCPKGGLVLAKARGHVWRAPLLISRVAAAANCVINKGTRCDRGLEPSLITVLSPHLAAKSESFFQGAAEGDAAFSRWPCVLKREGGPRPAVPPPPGGALDGDLWSLFSWPAEAKVILLGFI